MAPVSKRKLVRALWAPALVASLVVAAMPVTTQAADGNFVNRFERSHKQTLVNKMLHDTTRVPNWAGRFKAASGQWYVVAGKDAYAFSRLNGYSDTFPANGYTTSVDIYLDMSKNQVLGTDRRFDWSSAINGPDGNHRRDFIFHVGTNPNDTGNFIVSVSNNAPGNPAAGKVKLWISRSGWYTFKHTFREDRFGQLAVDMRVIDSNGKVLKKWTRKNPTDVIGETVGGNRYVWLVNNDFYKLRLDNLIKRNR